MNLGDLYNTIAKSYTQVDYFKINSSALHAAIEQLQLIDLLKKNHSQVLDLGSGDGKLLALVHELFPMTQLVAVDVSTDMLKYVKTRLPRVSTIQASISDIHQQLPAHQFDLLLASFVCAYVGLPTLLKQANTLLKPQRYFQLLTTTREAFANVQSEVERIGHDTCPWKKLLHWWMKKTLNTTMVPKNFTEISQEIAANGFHVVQRQQQKTEVIFNSVAQARDFAEQGGWAISLVNYPWLPSSLLKKIAASILKYMTFPFHDEIIVEIVLLQKN